MRDEMIRTLSADNPASNVLAMAPNTLPWQPTSGCVNDREEGKRLASRAVSTHQHQRTTADGSYFPRLVQLTIDALHQHSVSLGHDWARLLYLCSNDMDSMCYQYPTPAWGGGVTLPDCGQTVKARRNDIPWPKPGGSPRFCSWSVAALPRLPPRTRG